MSNYLLTGAAGFIASRVANILLERGDTVVGIDSLNDAYDPRLKHFRLKSLQGREGFTFLQGDITDRAFVDKTFADACPIDAVINLAARAGVRQSVENPWAYVDTNTTGTLEPARSLSQRRRQEIPAGLDLQPLRQRQRSPLQRRRQHQQAAVALRRVEESRRGALLHLSPPVRHRRHGLSLLHRLRPVRPPGHEHLPLHPMDQRRAACVDLRRRPAIARLHLRRRHRPRHGRRPEAAGLRSHQPGLR